MNQRLLCCTGLLWLLLWLPLTAAQHRLPAQSGRCFSMRIETGLWAASEDYGG